MGGSFLDGDREVVGHPHRKDREVDVGRSVLEVVTQTTERAKDRADLLGLVYERGDGHQPGEPEVTGSPNLVDKGPSVLDGAAGLLRFTGDVDLEENRERALR